MQQSFRLQAFHLFDVTFLTTHSLLCETFNQFTSQAKIANLILTSWKW